MSNEEECWKDNDFLSLGDGDQEFPAKDKPANVSDKEPSQTDLPPWMDQYTDFRRVPPLVALHNEIVGFENLMKPMPSEMEERNKLVDRFKELVDKTFGAAKCEIHVFGSQAMGLCLPSSDIDVVIQISDEKTKDSGGEGTAKGEADKPTGSRANSKEGKNDADQGEWKDMREKSPLSQLGESLRADWRDQLSYLEVIPKTKVPLVKFTHAPTGISVDASFLKENGIQAATLMKTFMEAMPPLRPLIFVLKHFLCSRAINEPYNGGVGSHLVQLLIVSYLQQKERESVNSGSRTLCNLGSLLLEFLEFYGAKFSYPTTGVSVRHDGSYFRKGEDGRREHFSVAFRPFSLAVENPFEITSDVGKTSFRFQTVQRAFAAAYKVLLPHVASPVQPVVSILATVLPTTEAIVKRKRAKVASLVSDSSPSKNCASISDEMQSPQRKRRRLT